MKILIIIMDIIYGLFDIVWLLIRSFFDIILVCLSKLISFIFRLKCNGCRDIDHISKYLNGHYVKRFWCIPRSRYMIFRCYKYSKKYKKKT